MSLKGQKKKSKSKGVEKNHIYMGAITFFIIISAIVFCLNNILHYKSLEIIFIMLLCAIIVVFGVISQSIKKDCFNDNKRFNGDSKRICLYCVIPSVLLIIFLSTGRFFIKNFPKYFKPNSSFSAIIIILLSIYFWFFYFFRCKKAIIEIGSDKYLFYSKAAKSMLTAALIFFSAAFFIESFNNNQITVYFHEKYNIVIYSLIPEEQNFLKLLYRVINICVNSMYPFIDMYVYVRSEIDEFDKQEQEKREEQEKQKRKELEQEKQEQEKREQLIKEKRELLEREKH